MSSCPEDNLLHLLTVLPDRFAANADAAIDDLLSWAEEMRRAFALDPGDYERLLPDDVSPAFLAKLLEVAAHVR